MTYFTTRRRRSSMRQIQKIELMLNARMFFNANESVQAIADFLNKSPTTIRRWLKVTGVTQ